MRRKFNLILIMILIFNFLPINIKAEINTDNNKKGTVDTVSEYVTSKGMLTISNITSDELFKAYKIMDTYYNKNNNTITYEFSNDFKSFLLTTTNYKNLTVNEYSELTSGDVISGSTTTSSTLDKLVSLYISYIKNNNVNGVDIITNNTSASASLEAGSYLILPIQTNRVYAVMVGNLEYDFDDSSNFILKDVNIVAKTSGVKINAGVGTSDKLSDSFNKGEEFNCYITSNIPKYPTNSTNKKYEIKAVLSDGITFNGINTIEILDGEEKLLIDDLGNVFNNVNKKIATISFLNQNLLIDFDTENISSNIIYISYKAKLNDSAVSKNISTASLTYSNDPYGINTKTILAEENSINTYGIKLFVHEKDKTEGLENSIFDVYLDSSLTTKIGSITTDSMGNGEMFGLKEGNYYLKAKKAPSGYNLLSDTIIVGINIDESPEDKIFTAIDISLPKKGLLPVTGSWKSLTITIIGILITFGAIYIYKLYQKKSI